MAEFENKPKGIDARITELRDFIDEAKTELRELVKEQEKESAQKEWSEKVDGLNDAQLEALEEALKLRASSVQKVGIAGIESTETISDIQ